VRVWNGSTDEGRERKKAMNETVHIVCPQCDAVNRIPPARLGDRPNCGKCHHPLFSGRPLELTTAAFQKQIERTDIPILVDFWASWCGPCQAMAPAFAKAAETLEPRIRLAKVNTEEEQELAAQFGIRSIPTLILFRHGREAARQAGAMSEAEIIGWVQAHT
jgi:thioredoxin 2